MSDEAGLHKAETRGSHAQALLNDEILMGAFKTLEDGYTAAWRSTNIDDVSGREKLFLAVNIIGKIRDHLAIVVRDGKLAQAEMKELLEAAERKKRFGII